jgi:pyridoxamine 5'-phosphate oxidase
MTADIEAVTADTEPLTTDTGSRDPLDRFRNWYEDARSGMGRDADVVALATASSAGAPSVRFVHFKELHSYGFVFYTNYGSRKALDIASNPLAAMAFNWQPLRRQVRVEGHCRRLEPEESERYFATRGRESQLTAAASMQSREMASFDVFRERIEDLRATHADQAIPCPVHWGGVILTAERIEFWQGQLHRRHKRYQYDRGSGGWSVRLLYP